MPYDICAIGNALVDIIIAVDDDFLQRQKIARGGMTLLDFERSMALYEQAPAAIEMSSGGSAANTLAGIASLGGEAAFIGKIGADEFGKVFAHDLQAQAIHFHAAQSTQLTTGRCLSLVTPDAQRSMATYLGAAVEFGPDDVDPSLIAQSAITYLEGYLFDKPAAKQAFLLAAQTTHQAGKKLALSLSDAFCVERHRDDFLDLVRNQVDILFANEAEIKALCQTQNLHTALNAVRGHCDIVAVTLGASGAVILAADKQYDIAAHPVQNVIDTTGAGDQFAAGFLYGVTQGKTLPESARIGIIAAAEVISHYGPRPQTKLSSLL